MSDRSAYFKSVRTIVVKLGTQLLSAGKTSLDEAFLRSMASQVQALRKRGMQVSVVSSGAIGCGVRELGLESRPTDLAKLQAVAAVGQRRLMDAWAAAFGSHGAHVAQLLLTRQDIDDRTRFLNLRNTIAAVHELGAVPVVNENDTISTAELVKITFGDNDILAAVVAHALRADLLVLLSAVDGLLDGQGKTVGVVSDLEEARQCVREEKSALGRGGMESKIEAARMVTEAGELMVLADGRQDDVLQAILDGKEVGTLFVPPADRKKRSSRDRWIGSVRPVGWIVVDQGAAAALSQKNRSLLAAGITELRGTFSRGDVVGITGPDGQTVARGLSNYNSADLDKIRGKKTQQVRQILGEGAYDEVVHRNNLILE